MNIRKKLTVASVLMILVPIIVSMTLCIIVLFFHGSGTLNRMMDLYDDDNGLLNVQSILYNYKDRIITYRPVEGLYDFSGTEEENAQDGWVQWDNWDNDWDDEWDDDWDDDEEDLWELEEERQDRAFGGVLKELSMIGYSYEIYYGGQVIVSNLPENAEEQIVDLAGIQYKTLSSFSVTDGESSVIKRTYTLEDDDNSLSLLAYCDSYVSASGDSQVIREFLSIMGIFAVILVIAVIICIFILTKWLSGGMKKSLLQLSEGVRQVQEGNLDYRINSTVKDELGKACREFDEMAAYLENSVREREKYEEAKKQLLAGISHDLRTPLTSIKAYVEGLQDGIANTEEKKQRYYAALKTRIGDLENLIDNLSLFSRFDRGEYHYFMEDIYFGKFVQSFFKENEIELKGNHVNVVKTAWPKKDFLIWGDPQQLRRVLGNLIDNTVKYREKPETKLTAAFFQIDDKLRLELSDDGPGVPPEERDKIFDAFFRGDKARRNPGNGSGLGLSIVQEIVKGHRGKIWAEEGAGGIGLKIILELPIKTDEEPIETESV